MNWYKSNNNYFKKPAITHKLNRGKVKYYLEEIKGYSPAQANIYLAAYDYFVINPEEFDGATMTEDLCDVKGLELTAMLHDYLYIALNASASLHFIRLADKLFFQEMKRMDKSSWNLGYRKFALWCVRRYWVWFCVKFKYRKMTIDNQIEFLETYKIMIQ